MEVVKETKEYTVYKKKSGRYGVQASNKKWINGDEKVKILLAEGLIKAPTPKPQEEAPAEETVEATAEETVEEATEKPAEEAAPPAAD